MNIEDKLFSFLDSLCSTYLSIVQARSPELFEGRGVVIPEAQVTSALSGQRQIEPWPDFAEHFSALCGELNEADGPLGELFCKLKLTDIELFVLLLAFAPEKNRKYERVFGYLQDNIGEKYPTLGLAADLLSLIRPVRDDELFALCDGEHRLNRYALQGHVTGLSRQLKLRESAVLYLSGSKRLGGQLKGACSMLTCEDCEKPLLREEEMLCCARFAKLCIERQNGKTGLLALYGAEGSGRRFCLRRAAGAAGRSLLLISCEELSALDGAARRELLEETVAYCMLQGAIPALLGFDFEGFSEVERISAARETLSVFSGALPLLALCGTRALKLRMGEMFQVLRYEPQPHTIAEQSVFWQAFFEECSLKPEEGIDCLSLANNFSLTPGQIRQVLSSADAESLSAGRESIGMAEISSAVRALCRPRLGALTEPMDCRFTWDDLLLDERAMATLRQVCDRIRYRWRVNEEWGFDRKLPYGKGVSVLLFGPPGTGKTMTAQVLAKEFGLDAYRVDLSRIMDKYIGETEKKLGELFDAAKDSNAILFFDEAEALFSKRTEVSDSKDKYANAETAYLLQRMEQHNGICLLATNNLQNFDKAFKRRITFTVSIEMPDAATRLLLWKKVFPKEAPLSPKLNFELLAERAELTGSSIKAAALSAAYIAAASGGDITEEILRGCIVEEMKKNGKIVAEYELM